MTTRTSEIGVKQRLEIEDIVAQVLQMMIDLSCEEKRQTLTEIDGWVSLEEASHAKAEGQEH